jgi:integrase
MAGNITRRGTHSWRIKFEAGERHPATGKRQTRYVTVNGTKKDAQRELIRLLAEVESGTAVDPSKVTLAQYMREWLDDPDGLSPKTLERYRQLAEQQIIPHLGATALQKLRPAQIGEWHLALLKAGGARGRPLSARTVGHAHRVLHRALERAMGLEIISRNVAHVIRPPAVEAAEVAILSAEQIAAVLSGLDGHWLYPIAALALATGMRRGELCGLAWGAVDRDAGDGTGRTQPGRDSRRPALQVAQDPRGAPSDQPARIRCRNVARAPQGKDGIPNCRWAWPPWG